MTKRPIVLFACVHNSGRSVAAAALTRHYAAGAIDVLDAGSDPLGDVNPIVAKVLAQLGLPLSDHKPTRLDYDLVERADVVVTLGCNEACPAVPGKHIIDWPVNDPEGRGEQAVRRILTDLDNRVRDLVAMLAPGLSSSASVLADPHDSHRGTFR